MIAVRDTDTIAGRTPCVICGMSGVRLHPSVYGPDAARCCEADLPCMYRFFIRRRHDTSCAVTPRPWRMVV